MELVQVLSSRWICGGLLALGCVGYAIHAVRKKDAVGVLLAAVIGGAGGWLCTHLPPSTSGARSCR
ncbi:MAG: hypothetical protein R3F43_17955 [bacterium]